MHRLRQCSSCCVPNPAWLGRRTGPGSVVDPKFTFPDTDRGPWARAGTLRVGTTPAPIPIKRPMYLPNEPQWHFPTAGAELGLWSTPRAPKSSITHNNKGNIRMLWSQSQTSPRISRIHGSSTFQTKAGTRRDLGPALTLLSPLRVKAEAAGADGVRNFTLLLFVVKKSTNSS